MVLISERAQPAIIHEFDVDVKVRVAEAEVNVLKRIVLYCDKRVDDLATHFFFVRYGKTEGEHTESAAKNPFVRKRVAAGEAERGQRCRQSRILLY